MQGNNASIYLQLSWTNQETNASQLSLLAWNRISAFRFVWACDAWIAFLIDDVLSHSHHSLRLTESSSYKREKQTFRIYWLIDLYIFVTNVSPYFVNFIFLAKVCWCGGTFLFCKQRLSLLSSIGGRSCCRFWWIGKILRDLNESVSEHLNESFCSRDSINIFIASLSLGGWYFGISIEFCLPRWNICVSQIIVCGYPPYE